MTQETTMELMERRLQLPRKNLARLQFILEGYDRMFTVTTLDAGVAVVQISVPPSCCGEAMAVITALQGELDLQWMPIER